MNYARRHAGQRLLGLLARAARLSVLLVLALLAAQVQASSQQGLQTEVGRLLAPDISRIVKRGELVVALTTTDTEPFFFVREGRLQGVDIELAEKIGSALGVPVRFDRSPKTHDEVIHHVAIGRADLGVGKLARTLKRAQSVVFSVPYIKLEHGLLINRAAFARLAEGQTLSQTVRRFNGTIGVIAGSAWEEFASRNFPLAKIVPFRTWGQALEAVQSGEVVSIYRDALELQSFIRSKSSLALTLRTITFRDLESTISVMINPQDIVLRSFIDELIAQWIERPSVTDLLKALK